MADQKDADLVTGSQIALTARILSGKNYYPFGMAIQETGTAGSRYGYNGKPQDCRLGGVGREGSYDYGFRAYDASLARFFAVDPLREKYPELTPYQFASNTPIQAIDLDGLEAFYISYPDYKADMETQVTTKINVFGKTIPINVPTIKLPTGHAGLVVYTRDPNNPRKGITKYYEYGRYNSPDQAKGVTRTVTIPDLILDRDGKPTQASIDNMMAVLSHKSGHDGKVEAVLVPSADPVEVKKYADTRYQESKPGTSGYNPKRANYSILDNNCGTFALKALQAGAPTTSGGFSLAPNGISNGVQSSAPENVRYIYLPK